MGIQLVYTTSIDVSNNSAIVGTIPPLLLASLPATGQNAIATSPLSLSAFGTALSGQAPQLWIDPVMVRLSRKYDLHGTSLDFCSEEIANGYDFSTRTFNSSTTRLTWLPTDNYILSFINCDFSGTNACQCPQYYPSKCLAACTPSSSSSPSDALCNLDKQPSSSFYCIDGTWTATSNVITGSLTVSGVVVYGGLSWSQSLEESSSSLPSYSSRLLPSYLL